MKRSRDGEDGTALILTLAFVVVLGLIGSAMLSSISSGMHSRVVLDQARKRQYAADSAIQYAVTQIRALPAPGAAYSSCAAGTHYSFTSTDDPPVVIRVNCSNLRQLTRSGFEQRNVLFKACVENGVDCDEAHTVIRAQVNFQTIGSGGSDNVTRTWVQSWSVRS